ncbi:hypothetical protein V1515DRAFT_640202 [Lipomyces mesembrius]
MAYRSSRWWTEPITSEYEDVFRLLSENPPEQILDVHLSYSKYPYLGYHSLTETVTVVTVPNSIHEVELAQMIYLSEHAPELLDHILRLGSTTKKDFDGDYVNSSKQPDGGIVYGAIDSACVTIAVEVGISQSYKSLCDAKDQWPSASHGYYSPIFYRGHRWTGEMSGAFIEIWRAGCSSPDRYELIQDGVSSRNLPTTVGLKMIDLCLAKKWDAASIPDREIPFNGPRFMRKLMWAMLGPAQDRFRRFIAPP